MLEHSGNSKVTDLDRSILVHENILSFQVSVQDFAVVDVLDSQSHLHKPIQDLVFTVAHLANLLLICNFGVQITSVGIVHDDAEAALVHK